MNSETSHKNHTPSVFYRRLLPVACWLACFTAVQAAPDGASLYDTHCAVCHGVEGNGGVGVPLSLASFLGSVDDRFLSLTIRYGRPGRVMPAFPALSDAQLAAIVGHMRSWSDQTVPKYSAENISGDVQRGAELFASHCAACHGENGEGGNGTGVTFSRPREHPIIAPALNNAGFLKAATDEMIRATLREGREGTPMQSFTELGLSVRDIDDIVSFVRSFEQQDSVQKAKQPGDIPRILSMESPYSLDETVETLKQAIVSQNFIIIRTDMLEHGLVDEGEENQNQVILHFCNFRFLFNALAVDPRVGLFLPCRVTVTEKDGKVMVSTINPLYLSHLFNNNELDEYCSKMQSVYLAIMEDATL